MLVNGKELVTKAREGGYGIGAFNVNDYVTTEIVMKAAEELGTPIMLQTGDYANPSPEARRMSDFDCMNFTRYLRERAEVSPVPIVIHLDHCPTYEGCVRAIQYGATSVMLDASMKPFDENVALTNKVIELARSCNVNVEAEIGHVGGHANSTGEVYTSVEDAKRFVEATGVDMLAVSIGTVHGVYASDPVLQYELIAELRDAIPAPLVMHGSSGLLPEQFQNAVKNGICKINFATYLQLNAGEAIRKAAIETGEGKGRLGVFITEAMKSGVEYIKAHIGYFGTPSIY